MRRTMSHDKRPAMQYMSTMAFNRGIFSYDQTLGLQPLSGANSTNCPPGRILRETGKKLYPGAHPHVKTVMTSVFDSQTLLKGFIDTNSAIFTLYSVNRLPEQVNGADFNPRGANQAGVQHKGQSVYTLGDVVAGGQFYTINTIDLVNDPIINADFSKTTYYTLNLEQNSLLNASIVPPNKGTVLYLAVTGNSTSTLTFGQNFDGLVSSVTPSTGNKITIGFISDGSKISSLSQSGAGVVPPNFQSVVF
jgi:hypothetical protein